jgi:hypothetical protein
MCIFWYSTYYYRLTLTHDRPVLSSERAPPNGQDNNCQTVINIWSWTPDGVRHQDRQTDWLTVSRNVTDCRGVVPYLWLGMCLGPVIFVVGDWLLLTMINRLNKLRYRLLHSPTLTEIPVYIRTKCWVVFCECCVKCVYFLLNPWGEEKECNLRWNRVW